MGESFRTYQKYLLHAKVFNILFTFLISAILVGTFCWYLVIFWQIEINWLAPGTWFLVSIVPMLTCGVMALDPSCKIAYYQTWNDWLAGKNDQRRAMQEAKSFWSQEENDEVFLISTSYLKNLERQRNLLLGLIYREYSEELAVRHNAWLEANRRLAQAKIELRFAEAIKKNKMELHDQAKTASEIYAQRQSLSEKSDLWQSAEKKFSNQASLVESAAAAERELSKQYCIAVRQIVKLYEIRRSRYIATMTVKIDQLGEEDYRVIDFADVAEWMEGLTEEMAI